METLPTWLSNIGGWLGDAALWIATDGAKMLFNGIKKAVKFIRKTLQTLFMGLWNFITSPTEWMRIARNAGRGVESILEGMANVWEDIPEQFMEKIREMWTSFKEYWGISSPSSLMEEAAGNILDGFFGPFEGISETFNAIWSGMVDGVSGYWDDLKNLVSATEISEWASSIIDDISEIPSKMGTYISTAWTNLTSTFSM